MSEQGEAGRPKYLTARYVRAGTDPDSGAVVLSLDVGTMGFDAPDQRYKLEPRAARKVGAQLLLAADPEMAARLLVNEHRGLGQVLARGEGVRTLEPEVTLDFERVSAALQPGSISDPEAYERAIARGDLRAVGRARPTLVQQLLSAASTVVETLMKGDSVPIDQLSALDEAVSDLKWHRLHSEAPQPASLPDHECG